ncbi:hypothetical protein [Thermoflavimicrobium daqui]|uniref:SseB protein N-terminal domain-containing protein n=1 Tax=Thermoflavimicrobium daqui TaxID=2137476 RepID=A0A364K5R8_9BACL|nr:hypothetical protein [Thermoflavimicrobium daqui]RAL25646.1 hypothetical protein DL897_06085 [Thermoflavimicrobium daqui]
MNIREWFEYASSNNIPPEQIYQFMTHQVNRIIVLYQNVNKETPFFAKGNRKNSKLAVAFTDVESARQVQVEQPQFVKMIEESTLSFLIKMIRLDVDGMVINPGLPSRYFLMKQYLKDLLKEFFLVKLTQIPGPWIPTQGQNLLCVDTQQGGWSVAIYASDEDARYMSNQSGINSANIMHHSWQAVFEWCRNYQINTPPILHYGLPEAISLTPQDMERIVQGPMTGYQEFQPVVHPFVNPIPDYKTHEPKVEKADPVIQKPKSEESTLEKTNPVSLPQVSQPINPDKLDVKNEDLSTSPEALNDNSPQNNTKSNQNQANPVQPQSNPNSLRSFRQPGTDIYLVPKPQITMDIADWPIDDFSTEKDTIIPLSNPLIQKPLPINTVDPAPVNQAPKEYKNPEPKEPTQDENPGVDPDIKENLQRLKQQISTGAGVNSWAVCNVLAELRKIWVITTNQKGLVILAQENKYPVIDIFTSKEYAQNLIDKERARKPELPPLVPQLVETNKLYRKFERKNPAIYINRSSSVEYRVGLGDPLPYILQRVRQIGK